MGFFETAITKVVEVVASKAVERFLLLIRFKKKYNKHNTHILFIDDEEFPILENLRDAGWSVVRLEDLKNIDDDNVIRSQIIFVDYKNVGKHLSKREEGIGLIKALKVKYKKKKRVILYSGHNRFNLGHDIKAADNFLSKNSESYEFIQMIESELKEIR